MESTALRPPTITEVLSDGTPPVEAEVDIIDRIGIDQLKQDPAETRQWPSPTGKSNSYSDHESKHGQ